MVCLELPLYMILSQEWPFKHSKTPVSHFVAWCYDIEKGKRVDFIQNVIHPDLFLCLSAVLLPWRLSLPLFPTSIFLWKLFDSVSFISYSIVFSEWCILAQFMYICCIVWRFQIFFRSSRDTWNPWGLSEGPQRSLQKAICMWCVVASTLSLCVPAALEGFNERPVKFMYVCLTVYSQFRLHLVMVQVIIWILDYIKKHLHCL